MAEIFISYSRKDRLFVQELCEALAARERETWVDLEGIPPTAEWWREIAEAITAAQTFVFVVSPDSIASEVCRRELAFAVEQHKRLIPIMRRHVDPGQLPDAIAKLQLLPFCEGDDFNVTICALINAIDTDLEWVRDHTRLLLRAAEWKAKARDESYLLRAKDLEQAEWWCARADGHGEVQPTQLQRDYITASHRFAVQRRWTIGAVAVVLLISGVFAWWQHNRTLSQGLATQAESKMDLDPELSVVLATEAVETASTAGAIDALRRALLQYRTAARAAIHDDVIANARFSPGGNLIATASEDRRAALWGWTNSREKPIMLNSHTRGINSIEFGGDGKYVVTASSDGTAIVWASGTGSLLNRLEGHKQELLYASFDRSGDLIVTASVDKTAKVWGWQHQVEPLRILQGHQKGVTRAEFSRDGDLVLTTSTDASARIWNWRTSEPAVELRTSGTVINIAKFSPDGRVVATGDRDGWVRVWDSQSGKEFTSLDLHKFPVIDLAFSPDTRLIATAGADNTAKIWEWQGGSLPKVLVGHQDAITSLTFSPDGGSVLTSSRDGTARVWDVGSGTESFALRGQGGELTNAQFNAKGTLVVTSSSDGSVRVWDAHIDQGALRLEHNGLVHMAVFSPDGRQVLTVSEDATARLWDAATGRAGPILKGHDGAVTTGVYAPGGKRLVTAGHDGTARVWDAATGQPGPFLRGHEGPIHKVVISPDERLIATASEDATVRVWDAKNGNQKKLFALSKGFGADSMELSRKGDFLVAGSGDGAIRVWDLHDDENVKELQGPGFAVNSLAFSPDGRYIVAAGMDGVARVYEWNARPDPIVLGEPGSLQLNSAVFSPDGRLVLTAGLDNKARIWEWRKAKEVRVLSGHTGPLSSAAFSPNGAWIVTTSWDRTARIWETVTGRTVAELRGHRDVVKGASFGQYQGRLRILTASFDRTAQIFDCTVCRSAEQLVAYAMHRTERRLTEEERTLYLPWTSLRRWFASGSNENIRQRQHTSSVRVQIENSGQS